MPADVGPPRSFAGVPPPALNLTGQVEDPGAQTAAPRTISGVILRQRTRALALGLFIVLALLAPILVLGLPLVVVIPLLAGLGLYAWRRPGARAGIVRTLALSLGVVCLVLFVATLIFGALALFA